MLSTVKLCLCDLLQFLPGLRIRVLNIDWIRIRDKTSWVDPPETEYDNKTGSRHLQKQDPDTQNMQIRIRRDEIQPSQYIMIKVIKKCQNI